MEHSTASPLLSSMSSSTELQPQVGHGTIPINPELFQTPLRKCPQGDNHTACHDCSDDELSSMEASLKIHLQLPLPPPPFSSVLCCEKVKEKAHSSEQVGCSHCTEGGQFLMNQRFQPYIRCQAPPLSNYALP